MIFCNHGDRLAFDRDGFGVNEKRVESFVSTLATGLSNGWGRGVNCNCTQQLVPR